MKYKAGCQPEVSDQSRLLPQEADNIFVWHQGALGDVLLAGPALQAVGAQYPGSHLTLVGGTEQLGLLTDTLPVAAVRSGHQGRWLELFQNDGDIGLNLKNFLSQFDLALVLTPLARPEFLNRLKQAIPQVVWLPSFPVSARVPVRELQAEKLRAVGLQRPVRSFRLIIPESERELARSRLEAQSRGLALRVALAPGSGHPRKNWPLDYYIELARILEKRYGAQIWWLLGPAEAGWQSELQKKIPQLRLLQNLPLRQLAAMLAEFQLYVGNDSGVTHLTAALGQPAVAAIFGPSDPVIWAPTGDQTVVVTSEQPCAPCTPGREINCEDPFCLSTLTPEKVLAAISRSFPEPGI